MEKNWKEWRVLLVLCHVQLSKLIQSSMCLNNETEREDKGSKFLWFQSV